MKVPLCQANVVFPQELHQWATVIVSNINCVKAYGTLILLSFIFGLNGA